MNERSKIVTDVVSDVVAVTVVDTLKDVRTIFSSRRSYN